MTHPTHARASSASHGLLAAFVAVSGVLAMGTIATSARAEAAKSNSSSFADTTKPVTFLKEVVVTGARYPRAFYESPQALSFLSRSQLRDQAPVVIGDALYTLPGVDNSKDSPWEQRPVLRGLSGQRVLVLMDGMPMNSARGNGPHPSLVDASQIERVEVVRGPSSVAYGSDAIGGAINIITREAGPSSGNALNGSAVMSGSTAEHVYGGQLELRPRIGKFSSFLSSGFRKADDFETPSKTVANSQYKDYNALFNLRYDLTPRLALKSGYQLYRGTDVGIPGLSFASPGASQAFQFSYYDRDLAHLTLEHRYPESWLASTSVKVYWQQERRNFFSDQNLSMGMAPAFGVPPRSGASYVVTDQNRFFDLDTYGGQIQLTSRKNHGYRWTTGIDLARDITSGDNRRYRTYYDSTNAQVGAQGVRRTQSVPDGNFDNYASFFQNEWYLHPKWTLSTGARYTHYQYRTKAGVLAPGFSFTEKKVDNDAISGSLGLVYAAAEDLHLSFNVANGYRQPNAQDLFFDGAASVGFVVGNPNLSPEKSISYDLGLRWGPAPFAFSGNVFVSTYDDLIDAIRVPPVPEAQGQNTYQYVNISKARIWGGEAEGELTFLRDWRARATVTGAVGDITSSEAIQRLYGVNAEKANLAGVPPFRGNASLRWTEPSSRFWLESGVRYSWRTNRLPLPTPGVSQTTEFKREWVAFDLTGGVKVPTGQRLIAGVRNLGDLEYRQALGSLNEPGRSFFASLSTDF